MTLSTRERDHLLLSDFYDLLDPTCYQFKLSKTRLSWKNQYTWVTVSTRGSRYSTAACSLRWVRVRIDSLALRGLYSLGAPVRGFAMSGKPYELRDMDLRDPPEACGSLQVELTDRASCREGAQRIASALDTFWQRDVLPWTQSPSEVITRLSVSRHPDAVRYPDRRISLDPLFGPDAPAIHSRELEELVIFMAAQTRWNQHRLLAELLLACGRIDDFNRLYRYVAVVKELSERDRSMPAFDDFHRWSCENADLLNQSRKIVSEE